MGRLHGWYILEYTEYLVQSLKSFHVCLETCSQVVCIFYLVIFINAVLQIRTCIVAWCCCLLKSVTVGKLALQISVLSSMFRLFNIRSNVFRDGTCTKNAACLIFLFKYLCYLFERQSVSYGRKRRGSEGGRERNREMTFECKLSSIHYGLLYWLQMPGLRLRLELV